MAQQQQDDALLQLLQEWEEAQGETDEWMGVLRGHKIFSMRRLERCADDAPSWDLLLDDLLEARETALRFNLVAWQRERAGGAVVAPLVAGMSRLSVQERSIRVGWGKPKGASFFALSSGEKSLDVVVCLCAASFWEGPGDDQHSASEVRRVFGALCGCETFWTTKAEKISETKGSPTVDSLMVEALRRVFSGSTFTCTEQDTQLTMAQLGCGAGPTSESSKPDFTATVEGLVVFIAEFKNNVTAPIDQLPQAAAEGCNSVLAQYCAGVAVAECRCELLLTNGHLFQFAVVTLLPPCMPRVMLTSRVLDYSCYDDAVTISRRLASLLKACAVSRERGPQRTLQGTEFTLDGEAYHEKPAEKWLLQEESPRCSERAFVRVFEQLWQCEVLREHIVFPIGFLREDGKLRSILFEKLDEEWSIGMPVAGDKFDAWREQLRQIVTMMHSCNVVHMDLMPCNIAWKPIDGGVQVKLLDFDAATSLSFRVGSKMQDLTLTNRRELMWQEQLVPDVRFDWWMYFLYREMPLNCRVGAPVSGEQSPAAVNGPFLKWLDAQDVAGLRQLFHERCSIERELQTEPELL